MSTMDTSSATTVRFNNSSPPLQPETTRRRATPSSSFCHCFRYGWYPLFVAILITAAFLLDLYSSMSCEFLRINVETDDGSSRGFAFIGIFLRQSGARFETNDGQGQVIFGQPYLAKGCQSYSSMFQETIIQNDNSWRATRYIAMISAASGGASTFISWIFVLTPISITCLWTGLLFPLVFIAFLGEGLKFLFLDVELCNAPLWSTNPTNCELATTAYICIASCVVYFISPILICLIKPQLKLQDKELTKIPQVSTATSEDSNNKEDEQQGMESDEENVSPKLDPVGTTLEEALSLSLPVSELNESTSPRKPIDP